MKKRIGHRSSVVRKWLLIKSGFAAMALLPALGIVNTPPGRAQSLDGPKPSFKTISIKPYKREPVVRQPIRLDQLQKDQPTAAVGSTYEPTFQPGGRFVKSLTMLTSLITLAYEHPSYKLSGTPSWGRTLPFSIEAEAGYDAGRDEMRLMLQSMLEDRFGLRLRREMREVPYYSLEIAEGGHKLQPAMDENGNHLLELPSPPKKEPTKEEIEAILESMRTASREELESRPGVSGGSMGSGRVYFYGNAVSIDRLVEWINGDSVYRQGVEKYRIIDRTGLSGLYNVKLEYYSSSLLPMRSMAQGKRSPSASDAELAGPSMFEAFEQQLGLKLRLDHGPIELFVIDSVHKPVMDE